MGWFFEATCHYLNQCLPNLITPYIASLGAIELTHLPLDKMATISQMTDSNAFSWIKTFVFWFEFHWRLFLRVQLTISQHWFRWWLGAEQVKSHYLNQCLLGSLMYICGTRGRWVNLHWQSMDRIKMKPANINTNLLHGCQFLSMLWQSLGQWEKCYIYTYITSSLIGWDLAQMTCDICNIFCDWLRSCSNDL